MKIANLVVAFLRDEGIGHVFCVSGGANLHLIHGINETQEIEFICPQTEQAAGFAADAYARFKGIGCALATSGPGATNLVTPIATSYYDSVPVLYITGNVTRDRMSHGTVRQLGFQETPIVPMVKRITKYAETAMTPETVIWHLKAAVREMKSGRKGPALVDIPDDIQRSSI